LASPEQQEAEREEFEELAESARLACRAGAPLDAIVFALMKALDLDLDAARRSLAALMIVEGALAGEKEREARGRPGPAGALSG
jgi:hypothetical protein